MGVSASRYYGATLCVRKPAETSGVSEPEGRQFTVSSPPGRGTIALAADAVILREGLARLLRGAGFDVVGLAADGDELLELVDGPMS
jgi:hypothetical protein